MRHIPNLPLDPQDQQALDDLQGLVNDGPVFAKKVKIANKLWGSKGGANGKKVFKRVQEKLKDMCIQEGICNYCEQNEATDIEHIEPKGFFPEKTFDWMNFILACKTCNTHYKLDKWFVFDQVGRVQTLIRKNEPTSNHGAFIQIRVENPEDFMLLNSYSFTFEILPELTDTDMVKAEKTLEILQLNHRDVLIHARRQSAKYFSYRMRLLVQVRKATTEQEIIALYAPYDPLPAQPFTLEELKAHCQENIRLDILSSPHLSVWSAICKIDSKVTPYWQEVFTEVPEALTWLTH